MDGAVIDNAAANRFELALEGGVAFIAYHRSGLTLYLDHAEVPAALGRRGVGTRLVRDTLELVRARGERIVPVCSFVREFVRRQPAYADLCAS